MLTLKEGTRLIQTFNDKKNNTYTLMNIFLNYEYTINYKAAKIINKISKLNNPKSEQKLIKKYNDFISSLKEIKILEDKNNLEKTYNTFVLKKHQKLPLSCLNIELTNGCNLRCIHCYGMFGNSKSDIQFIDKEKLINLIPQLNLLNCKSVSFTGGESTLHPDFLEIIEEFIKNGFEISIFTNGFNSKKIIQLVNKYPNFPFIFKISIDGYEEIHDKIRGREGSYKNVIKLLDFLSTKDCINTYLSNTIMKCNIDNVNDFENFIKSKYPKFNFSKNLIFPLGNGCNQSFTISDFKNIYQKCPSLFKVKQNKEKTFRCSGGISQCTLVPNGNLKICNGACDKKFFFKRNAFDDGLVKAWYDCGKNISFFRKEKNKSTQKCKNCKSKNNCLMTDCRILALAYLGDEKQNSPFTCFSSTINENK